MRGKSQRQTHWITQQSRLFRKFLAKWVCMSSLLNLISHLWIHSPEGFFTFTSCPLAASTSYGPIWMDKNIIFLTTDKKGATWLMFICLPRWRGITDSPKQQKKLSKSSCFFGEFIGTPCGSYKVGDIDIDEITIFNRCTRDITGHLPGAPNVTFRKISVRKTIGDREFSEHFL